MGEPKTLGVHDEDGTTTERVEQHKNRTDHDSRSRAARELIEAGEAFLRVKDLFGVAVWAVVIMQLFVGAGIIVLSAAWWQSAAGVVLIGTAGIMFALWRSLEDDINGHGQG